MQKILLMLGILAAMLFSCHPTEKNEKTEVDCHARILGDSVMIPENSPLQKHVKLQAIQSGTYNSQYTTTGTVRVVNGGIAEISTPFEGRVTKSFVKLGQKVAAGTPVFEIYSPEYFETVKSFIQAKQEKQLAATNFSRQKDLLDHHVGSQKDYDEAEAALQIATKEYEKTEASLLIFNVKPEEVTVAKPLIVRSPIAGEIVKNSITVGQYLKSDAEPLAAVANLAKVWVVAQVKEKNISLINTIDSVRVITDAHPEKPVNGFVSYVGNLLDEQTRSVEVYVECRNDNRSLKPGMFANVTFTHQVPDALVVPSNAILQEEENAYVFVQTAKNRFIKRSVTVATGNGNEAIIRSGLTSGETIVTEGAVYLR